jgi:hypothetical protein
MKHLKSFQLFENIDSHNDIEIITKLCISSLASKNADILTEKANRFQSETHNIKFYNTKAIFFEDLSIAGKGLSRLGKKFIKFGIKMYMGSGRQDKYMGAYRSNFGSIEIVVSETEFKKISDLMNKHRDDEYYLRTKLNNLIYDILVSKRETIVHELQHAWDDFVSDGKYRDKNHSNAMVEFEKGELDEYHKLSHEINARFSDTVSFLNNKGLVYSEYNYDRILSNTWNNYVKCFKHNFSGWDLLTGEQQKRLMVRLSQHYYRNISNQNKGLDITDKVEVLCEELRAEGIEIWMWYNTDTDSIKINQLYATSEEQEQAAMDKIIRLADIYRKFVVLTPHSKYLGIKLKTFIPLLKSLGFRRNAGNKIDYRFRESMMRAPKRNKSLRF